jgi:regulator of nonsense transcripts 1
MAFRDLRRDDQRSVKVQLHLEASKATMLAELGALDRLTKGAASTRGKAAFRYLMDFKNSTNDVDLHEIFPHLANLDEVPDIRLREELKRVVDNFDEDQTRAMLGISSLPEGICFVPGGPGAGKTWWALTMAILADSGEEYCRTLYLLDINKPVDDAADRMHSMCSQLGIEKSVIRLVGWPLVDVTTLDVTDEDDALPEPLRHADFTEGFLRAQGPAWPSSMAKAPTLDEKAWERYSADPKKHVKVDQALQNILSAESNENLEANIEALRKGLIPLYFDTLRYADFIATTPVTAPRVAKIFKPRLVIFDECAHARELSTMISLAYFEPKAWFFVGDHRQTEPFVEARKGKFRSQLRLSTMERAEKNGAVKNQLLVNHRAFGRLERLASDLFYDGIMRSDKAEDELFPPSVRNRLSWLEGVREAKGRVERRKMTVPRLLIIHEWTGERKAVQRVGTSCWNPKHQEIVMEQVDSLLQDRAFTQVDGTTPGTIMIISPYREAVFHYQGAVNKSVSKQLKRRVQVRTVDTAQGQEADVVFIDMANDHTTAHVENEKRLCVALTRARQAEVILMDVGMTGSGEGPVFAIRKNCRSGQEGEVLVISQPSQPSPPLRRVGWPPSSDEDSPREEDVVDGLGSTQRLTGYDWC